jgi:hypothetical protein
MTSDPSVDGSKTSATNAASTEQPTAALEASTRPVEFLRLVYPEGPWCLTAISPERTGTETRTFRPGREDELLRWLNQYNGARNLYWHVNPVIGTPTKKAERKDIAAVCYLHVDLDPAAGRELAAERARIMALLTGERPNRVPEPTLVISSGGGYQAFWKLSEPIAVNGDLALAEEAKRFNQQLELLFGGDKCHNIDRLMRLPFTMNLPDARKLKKGRKPALAEVVFFKPDNVYPISNFTPLAPNRAGVSAAPREAESATEATVAIRLEALDELTRWSVPDRIKVIIAQGLHPDPEEQAKKKDASRSGWLFDAVCGLLRYGVPDGIVLGIITDPRWAISDSVIERKQGAEKYALKQIASAREAMREEARGSNRAGTIIVNQPVVANLRREIEDVFVSSGLEIFRQDKRLVRVSVVEETIIKDGIVRRAGMVELVPVTGVWLADKASELATFAVETQKGMRRVAPTREHMAALLEITDESRFPLIKGLALTPTLGCDRPGYDETSQLYLAFPKDLFPSAPAQPSREDALAALGRLAHPLRGFPFVNRASRSVALSAMLSAVVRGEMRTCPLHGFDAPAAGTGKTKLALMTGLLALGVEPPSVTFGEEADENQKQLSSLLMTGCSAILMDNVDVPLKGAFLNGILTKDGFDTRILGLSKMVKLNTRALLMATGNNLRCLGDMARRAVVCRLDAKMSNPEERQFDFDPLAEVRAARTQLVVDALTVLRAYVAAGRPGRLPAYGSFEDWDLVRGALVWLGEADPLETKAMVAANDPKLQERSELIFALYSHYGAGRRFQLSDIDVQEELSPQSLKSKLGRMLRSGRWHKGEAGALLAGHKEVPFMGLTLMARPNRIRVNEWWLEGEPDPAFVDEVTERKLKFPF